MTNAVNLFKNTIHYNMKYLKINLTIYVQDYYPKYQKTRRKIKEDLKKKNGDIHHVHRFIHSILLGY